MDNRIIYLHAMIDDTTDIKKEEIQYICNTYGLIDIPIEYSYQKSKFNKLINSCKYKDEHIRCIVPITQYSLVNHVTDTNLDRDIYAGNYADILLPILLSVPMHRYLHTGQLEINNTIGNLNSSFSYRLSQIDARINVITSELIHSGIREVQGLPYKISHNWRQGSGDTDMLEDFQRDNAWWGLSLAGARECFTTRTAIRPSVQPYIEILNLNSIPNTKYQTMEIPLPESLKSLHSDLSMIYKIDASGKRKVVKCSSGLAKVPYGLDKRKKVNKKLLSDRIDIVDKVEAVPNKTMRTYWMNQSITKRDGIRVDFMVLCDILRDGTYKSRLKVWRDNHFSDMQAGLHILIRGIDDNDKDIKFRYVKENIKGESIITREAHTFYTKPDIWKVGNAVGVPSNKSNVYNLWDIMRQGDELISRHSAGLSSFVGASEEYESMVYKDNKGKWRDEIDGISRHDDYPTYFKDKPESIDFSLV